MTSKPATQKRTERPRTTGVAANRPVTAIHAPDRRDREAEPEDEVRERRDALRERVAENDESATGESARHSGLSRQAAKTKSAAAESAQKTDGGATDTEPAGMSRAAVRGFAASIARSAMRLKAIAAERAPTIATRIKKSVRTSGTPPAARTAERSANGSAKTVCEKVTREKNLATPFTPPPVQRKSAVSIRDVEEVRDAEKVGVEHLLRRPRRVERGDGGRDDRRPRA